MKIQKCPISNDANGVEFLNLGNIPIEEQLTETREESLIATRYPMVLQFFSKSKLVSLTQTVNKDDVYLNYLYHSHISKPYLEHCNKMYDYLIEFVNFKNGGLIADIGGNDGSLLLQFKNKNPKLELLNVECSKSFIDINKSNNIELINDYFGEQTIFPKKAKLITSTNVFQHTEPLRSFVKGIYNNLDDDGVWSLEFPYLSSTLYNDNYDQAYHEHVYYYCLTPLKQLFEQEGLKIINVSFHSIHTGTLRVVSVKNTSPQQPDSTIKIFLFQEKFITEDYCIKWGNLINEKIIKFKEFLIEIKNSGAKIAGFGAAIKGCVFLNTCNLDYNTIDYVIDDTPGKQNKYIPGTGIEVVNRDILKTNQPDYILILAHNFKDYIIESLRKDFKGKFIVMFPNITIIE